MLPLGGSEPCSPVRWMLHCFLPGRRVFDCAEITRLKGFLTTARQGAVALLFCSRRDWLRLREVECGRR